MQPNIRVRFRVIANSGTIWNNDIGVDTVRLYGNTRAAPFAPQLVIPQFEPEIPFYVKSKGVIGVNKKLLLKKRYYLVIFQHLRGTVFYQNLI